MTTVAHAIPLLVAQCFLFFAFCEGNCAHWDFRGYDHSINVLELVAIVCAVDHFQGALAGKAWCLQSDNTAAISWVRRGYW